MDTSPREYLFHLERYGVKLGLDNIRHLLKGAGAPQDRYPAVHVAGTNGKGSVVAVLGAIARAAGYRAGRFTSPHLIDVTERFLIDGMPMSPAALDEQITFFRAVADRMDPPPTFFEMNTAIAFRWFAEQGVDLAMVEVGMGGRLDSTNVLLPLAAAITNIGLDHTRYLGDTLEQIAFEKAGIIKPRIPVVVAETTPPARDIILARADELGSPVYLRDRDFQFEVTGPPFRQQFRYESRSLSLGPAPLSLAGVHQGENAATAVALAERILPSFPEINTESISKGLGSARWPCRLERVMDSPPVILDVAHNPDGARKIAHALSRCVTVLAVSSDKDAAGIIAALAPVTSVFILTRFQGARAMPMETLCAAASGHFYRTAPDLTEAIRLGLSLAGESAPLLITGSIFTAGEARQILIKQYGAPPLAF